MSSVPPLLVFDLDGTIAETAGDLIRALNAVIVPEGLRPVALDEARGMVGAGARALIRRAYISQGIALEPADLERLFVGFLASYEANICVDSTLFPGFVAALDRLEGEGYVFAVCTNKHERPARRLCEALGIADRFRTICGQDTIAIAKPDPRILTWTIEQAGGAVATSVMIGDSLADIAAAKAAGVPVVAVDFGYTDRPVTEFSPDRVISHFDALDDAIRDARAKFDDMRLTTGGRLS